MCEVLFFLGNFNKICDWYKNKGYDICISLTMEKKE